jgi:hypothetical protein
MALEITGNIVLSSGLQTNSLYGRTEAWLSNDGKQVGATPKFYASKEAYINGAPNINLDGLKFIVDYDRATDGTDILLYANEYVKFQLEAMGYTATIIDL